MVFSLVGEYRDSYTPGIVDSKRASFGSNLRLLRRKAALSQEHLGRILEVRPSQISYWENGHRTLPRSDQVLELAKALNCAVEDFYRGVDAEYERQREQRASYGETNRPEILLARAADVAATLAELLAPAHQDTITSHHVGNVSDSDADTRSAEGVRVPTRPRDRGPTHDPHLRKGRRAHDSAAKAKAPRKER